MNYLLQAYSDATLDAVSFSTLGLSDLFTKCGISKRESTNLAVLTVSPDSSCMLSLTVCISLVILTSSVACRYNLRLSIVQYTKSEPTYLQSAAPWPW